MVQELQYATRKENQEGETGSQKLKAEIWVLISEVLPITHWCLPRKPTGAKFAADPPDRNFLLALHQIVQPGPSIYLHLTTQRNLC